MIAPSPLHYYFSLPAVHHPLRSIHEHAAARFIFSFLFCCPPSRNKKHLQLMSMPTGDKLTCRLEDRNNLTLERFLRARDFNVPVASALFISHRHACGLSPTSTSTRRSGAPSAKSTAGCFVGLPCELRPSSFRRKWRQSFAWRIPASDLPRQLPGQTKVALQGKCREGQPLMILIARNHISCALPTRKMRDN